jgi:hypothetical protein
MNSRPNISHSEDKKVMNKYWRSRPVSGAVVLLSALVLGSCSNPQQRISHCNGSETATSRLFLQQVTDQSAIIKWRGDAQVACVGTDINHLDLRVTATSGDANHKEARLTGLEADTVYFYSVGGAASGVDDQQFRSAPHPGEVPADGNTHIWLLGDSGTETEQFFGQFGHLGEAQEVKEGFLTYNREQADNEPLDLVLLLGDNAYLEGSDAQWQGSFFDIYPQIISRTPTWTTIGNHEMGAAPIDICLLAKMPGCDQGPVVMPLGGISESPDPASYDGDGNGPDGGGPPYLGIFSLPANGEAGGVASGTEQYYAFDYGNVHIVSLDSQLSNRDPVQRATMRGWLVDDLSQNNLDWTIVIFHHPPYSKGENHDSNLEQTEIDMRETFAPVFEDYGVDVVYSGHAHSYERSWYLNGHYGLSETFDADKHAQLNSSGGPALGQGDEAYRQISADSGNDDKAVYTVAGSAGKADDENPCPAGRTLGCTKENWLMHPAHRTFEDSTPGARPHGLARKGSVVLDATRTTLTSRFVDQHGEVLDFFTITRE